MTPLQKLTRLAQIERQLLAIDPMNGCEIRRRLEAERESIMRGIGHPPSELANSTDASAWALAMAETFEQITPEQGFPWFDAFGSAVYDKGREAGTREALNHINAGTRGLISALRTIREGARTGDLAKLDLDEFITCTLRLAGLT